MIKNYIDCSLVYYSNNIEYFCKKEFLPLVKGSTLFNIFKQLETNFPLQTKEKKFRMHLVQKNEDYLLFLKFQQVDQGQCNVIEMELCSYENLPPNNKIAQSKKEFLKKIEEYQKVIEEPDALIESKEIEESDGNEKVFYSNHLITGVNFKRDPEYTVSEDILKACINHEKTKQKLKKFRLSSEENELDLHFKVQFKEGTKILYVYLQKQIQDSAEQICIFRVNYLKNYQLLNSFESKTQLEFFLEKMPLIQSK